MSLISTVRVVSVWQQALPWKSGREIGDGRMASVSLPYTCRAVYSGVQGTMRIAEDALYWQQDR